MANNDRVDYEYELGNGWSKWQNLVLTSQKELRDLQEKHGEALEEIRINAAVAAHIAEDTKRDLDKLAHVVDNHDHRINEIEFSKVVAQASWKVYAKMGGLSVTLIGIILGIFQVWGAPFG